MPQSDARPQFWIFGGPNGSGKSTAYSRTDTERAGDSFWIINPDLLTRELQLREGLALQDANLQAVKRLETWLEATIRVHKNLGVETVLSTDKYRRLVLLAKEHGFAVHLVYVLLNSPALNVERVKRRVAEGGHDVPADKIVERYWRSLQQLPWFLEQADRAEIYDNSAAEIRLVAEKSDGEVRIASDAPENLIRQLVPDS